MSHVSTGQQDWTTVITPQRSWLQLNLRELWRYRDLLGLFVRRDIIAVYKQTILGPLWFVIQPLITTVIFTVIFGNIAKIGTAGVPEALFYLSGLVIWGYFSECLNKTSTTFRDNQHIFGKVYFSRLTVPLSIVLSNLVKLTIQFALFLGFYFFYLAKGSAIQPNMYIFLFPLLVILLAGLGLGCGLLVTSMTTKYRDLVYLLQFGIQLLMYASPVIMPLSRVPDEYKWIMIYNPLTGIIETFRYGFLGSGEMNWYLLSYSVVFTIVVLVLGIGIFNRTEKRFMDIV